MYDYRLLVNRLYGIIYLFLLISSILLIFFLITNNNQLESELEEIENSNKNYLVQIETLITENQLLSTQLSNLTLILENNLITHANLTINQQFQNNEIEIDGRSYSVVSGQIINFGLKNASDIEVEITWWILNDCGCDSIPVRTESVIISSIPSSSVYYFEETFSFTFDQFEFLVINLNWQ